MPVQKCFHKELERQPPGICSITAMKKGVQDKEVANHTECCREVIKDGGKSAYWILKKQRQDIGSLERAVSRK